MNIFRYITICISLLFISINEFNAQDCDQLAANLNWEFRIVEEPLEPNSEFFIECYVTNFTDILSFQYTLSFNPNVIEFDEVNSTGSPLIGDVEINDNSESLETGSLPILWVNLNLMGQTIPDGPIFKIFFDVIGNPGDCSNWAITSNSTDLEIAFELPNGEFCTELVDINFELTGNDSGGTNEFCIECGENLAFIPNACGGDFEFFACGGTAPYSYEIDGPGFNESGNIGENETVSLSGLPSGSYVILLQDANGSFLPFDQNSFEIENAAPLSVSINDGYPPITCPGNTTGLRAVAQGGVGPYIYEWSNGLFTDTISGIMEGVYSVLVTDANGCETMSLEETITFDPLVYNVMVTPATCGGSEDGTATITVSGGQPINGTDYEFTFLGEAPIGEYVDLNPGTYMIDIKDGANCITEVEFVIEGGTPVGLAQIVNEAPIECFGDFAYFEVEVPGGLDPNVFPEILDENGDLVANAFTPEGNLFPLTFLGPGMGNEAGVVPGTYFITVTTADGCEVELEYTASGMPPEIVINVIEETSPDCDGNPGQITVEVEGGFGMLTPSWNTDDEGLSFEVTEGGTYELIVADQNSCTATATFEIGAPGSLGLMTNVVQGIGCGANANSGIAEATVTSTSTGITYEWQDEDGMIIPSTGDGSQVEGLSIGTYTVTANDPSMDCTQSAEVTIDGAGTFFFEPNITPLTCFGGGDASIEAVISGGSGNFMYEWSHNPIVPNLNTASNLSAGTYTVTVTDQSDDCQLNESFTIENPEQVLITADVLTDVSCHNGSDASALATLTNEPAGPAGYNFFWGDLEADTLVAQGQTPDVDDLPSGNIFVFASDGCSTDTFDFVVINADSIIIDDVNSIIQDPPCAGMGGGEISLQAAGGTGDFDYLWDTGETSNNITDLEAGLYSVLVTDDNNCEQEFDFQLEEPDTLNLLLNEMQSAGASCFGSNSARIGVDATGGTGSYTYTWTPDIETDPLSPNIALNVAPGTYTVQVTDEAGCTTTLEQTVEASTPILAQVLDFEDIPCNSGSTTICVEASGGTGFGYMYQVSFNDAIPIDSCFQATEGQYEINVTDSEGCSIDQVIEIDVPAPEEILIDLTPGVELELGEAIEIDLGDTTFVIDPIITSVNPIDSIIWSSNGDWECVDSDCESINIFPTMPSIYTLLVQDINGCTAEADLAIEVNSARPFFAPNVFTPDNDGNNDWFHPFTGQGVSLIKEFRIYDRWGNLVHSRSDIDPAFANARENVWTGVYENGVEAVPGVYVYIAEVEFADNLVEFFKGSVTLIR